MTATPTMPPTRSAPMKDGRALTIRGAVPADAGAALRFRRELYTEARRQIMSEPDELDADEATQAQWFCQAAPASIHCRSSAVSRSVRDRPESGGGIRWIVVVATVNRYNLGHALLGARRTVNLRLGVGLREL